MSPPRVLTALALALATLPPRAAAQPNEPLCDTEYECEYRHASGYFWNMRQLCSESIGYYMYNTSGDDPLNPRVSLALARASARCARPPHPRTRRGSLTDDDGDPARPHARPHLVLASRSWPPVYVFQLCGNLQDPWSCVPQKGFNVQYSRGVAIQYDGPDPSPNQMCTNNLGFSVPCTRDCQVLGVGAPQWAVYDPSNPARGLNATFIGVDALNGDVCPKDFVGSAGERQVTIAVLCPTDGSITTTVQYVRELGGWNSPGQCKYEIVVTSPFGCGQIPDCYGKNCGPDGAGGYCGGAGNFGQCDSRYDCVNGVCCKPDCTGRQCGGDGCGGFCGVAGDGTCGAGGQTCSRYQQCVTAASASPQPSLLPAAQLSTSTPGDYTASYIGGIVAVPLALVLFGVVSKVRAAMAVL